MSDLNIEVSEHAHERLKERLGLPKSAHLRMAQKAFKEGKHHADAKGKLKRYLDGCWLRYRHCNNVRLHGENIWFFADHILVTVYEIPRHMRAGK